MHIEIWSDIACPWCYIGKRRFEQALAAFPHRDRVSVTWRSYQLDPSLPDHYDGTEAEYLSRRKGIPVEHARSMFAHVAAQARTVGLQYDFDRLVVANSALARELLHLAAEHGVGDQVNEALLSAHFEHGEDIGSIAVLTRIGEAAGLDASLVRAALGDRRYRPAVEADVAAAGRIGVQGVPFFVADEAYAVSGAQPVEVFTALLQRAWDASPHPVLVGAEGDACGPDGCPV